MSGNSNIAAMLGAMGYLAEPAQAAGLVGAAILLVLEAIILNRLRELGHKCAYLNTQTARIPAINLYAKFGFVPHIRTPEDLQVWSRLQEKLKELFDLDELAEGLDQR